jgi:hypothetical protein
MTDAEKPTTKNKGSAPGEPKRSRLRQILDERPEARPRLAKAFGALLGTTLVAITAMSILLIWHLVRRARLIREGLNPPRIVKLPEFPGDKVDRPS